MTDYTKLIERMRTDAIFDNTTLGNEAADAIEALQAKLGDAIQSSAHWQHQFTEAQAENERLDKENTDSLVSLATAIQHRDGFRKQLDYLRHEMDDLEEDYSNLQAERDALKELDVTRVILDITPGDGSGHEVYAKSVADVVNTLTQLDERDLSFGFDADGLRDVPYALQAECDPLQAKLDAAPKALAPEQVEAAWRAGWAACRDAEFVGQEAEDEAWGMSETCANADWESAEEAAHGIGGTPS